MSSTHAVRYRKLALTARLDLPGKMIGLVVRTLSAVLVAVGLKMLSEGRAFDLSGYPLPKSAAFAAGPHRRSG